MATHKILIINNEEKIGNYLKQELGVKGYNVSLAFSSSVGLENLKNMIFDIVIIKFGMPDIEGKKLVRELKQIDPDCVIVTMIEEMGPQLLTSILGLGVYEYIIKPINLERLFFIVRKGVELHSVLTNYHKLLRSIEEQKIALQKQNTLLTKRIQELTRTSTRLYENLHSTYMRTIKALAQTIDARDHYTHSHSENVSKYAVRIAEAMQLHAREVEMIRQACELHDVGKIGIQDQILTKETALTTEEREQIKMHPLKGAQILEPLNFLEGVIDLVCQHHEHYDGSGYPFGHKDGQIPLGARIIHVADAYDAMTSARAYRKIPLSKKEAIEEIKRHSGKQFDPKVVEAFLTIVGEL